MGVSRMQVNRIRHSKEKIQELASKQVIQSTAKVMANLSKFPEIDKVVDDWFVEMRNPKRRWKPMSISRAHIQARAMHEAKARGIEDFKASDGWFRNWRKRHGIGKSLRLFGEAGDVNLVEVEPMMQSLRQQLVSFKPENTFNADEAPLYFRAMPTRSYILNSETRSNVRGTKALKAKDRLTLLLCVNATGTCKIPPLLVGTAKNPHCFRDGQPPIPYINQKCAWVDRTIYKHWWFNIFMPAIRQWTRDPVALTMDNCSSHDPSCIDPTGQVHVFFFPPNVTSVYQPLDQGIIATIKTEYKRRMIGELIKSYDSFEKLQGLADLAKKGRKGLQFGCSANVLDASRIINDCWEILSVSTVVGCWIRSKCLPHTPTTIGSADRDYRTQSKDVADICGLFSSFAITVECRERLEALGLAEIVEIVQNEEKSNSESVP